jgi:hypothetical protein
MNNYIFPFDTCEEKQEIIAQPYSAFLNLINCFIILYFINKTTKLENIYLLGSLLLFEAFHVFSHSIHISGPIQTNITHTFAYFINIAFFNLFYNYTKVLPDNNFFILLFSLISFDFYALVHLSVIYYIIAQALIFLLPLIYYYKLLPLKIQSSIIEMAIYISMIILLIINEKNNCKKLMKKYNKFPFHILIEIVGIILFSTISYNFYNL